MYELFFFSVFLMLSVVVKNRGNELNDDFKYYLQCRQRCNAIHNIDNMLALVA